MAREIHTGQRVCEARGKERLGTSARRLEDSIGLWSITIVTREALFTALTRYNPSQPFAEPARLNPPVTVLRHPWQPSQRSPCVR